jgi:protein associated with RNAse G/E
MKVGEKLAIHCYKHNGKVHRTWNEATVLEDNDEWLVCGNDHVKVVEDDGRSHRTNEPAIMFFYKKRWFNIIAQLKPFGLFYYCNIASPYIMDENIIKYIDYDLDLRVFPDGGFRVLDKNEYKYHKKIMNYSDDLDIILNKELEKLINMKNNNEGPFDKKVIDKYFKDYMNEK